MKTNLLYHSIRSDAAFLRKGQNHSKNDPDASPDSKHETRPSPRAPLRSAQNAAQDTRPVYAIDLDLIDYGKAWQLQMDIVSARRARRLDRDVILFLEHPPVFTLGRRGGGENLLVSESFLKQAQIALTQVERGGDITYHGPGQLVVYPIVDLESARISVVDFVAAMEEIMIRTVGKWGIRAERNPINRGVWVGNKKIGSIGIALRKGVSFHGLALNINLDLTPFSWIQPCGLKDVRMTSMARECGQNVAINQVREVIKEKFQKVLEIKFSLKTCDDMRQIL